MAFQEQQQGSEGNIGLERALHQSLHALAREPDSERAIPILLRYTCTYYLADRVVIFEIDYDRGVVNNTYEWCAPGIPSRKGSFQDAPLETVGGWLDTLLNAGERPAAFGSGGGGMDKVLEERHVADVLALPLRRDGNVIGILGVDNPRAGRDDFTMLRLCADLVTVEFQKRQLLQDMDSRERYDRLTGLPNRQSYLEAVDALRRVPPDGLAVIFLDLNGIKEINEGLGHDIGDRFIFGCADILRELGLDAYRIDGDEFVALLPNSSREGAADTEARLRAALERLQPNTVSVGCAWGGAGADLTALINEADERMYADKRVYYRTAAARSRGRAGAASEILRDIREGLFTVYYQPQVDLKTGYIYGAEALVRKSDGKGGLVPPGAFIPVYETEGVIGHMDFHVLELVCADLKSWRERMDHIPKISVNFSRMTLIEPDVIPRISALCQSYGVPPSQIDLEVTESSDKLSQEQLRSLVRDLQEAGFSVSLDDFGSKYSNLSMLTTVGFQLIKLDKSLIDPICVEEKGAKVVRSLLELCRESVSTPTLAEGVEDMEQAGRLRDFGCNYVQGYYFSRPVTREDFTDMLLQKRRWPVEELPQTEKEALYSQTELMVRMAQESGSYAYSYLVRDRTVFLPKEFTEPYGIPGEVEDFPRFQVERGHVHPDSIDAWYGMFDDIDNGIPSGGAEVLLPNGKGGWSCYRLRYTALSDERRRPHSAIIIFEDITDELEQARRQQQDISGLIQATRKNYPELLTVNLTRNTYRIVQYDGATTLGTAREGSIDDMVSIRLGGVVEEDRELFRETFSVPHLQQLFQVEKQESVQLVYRRPGRDGEIYWFETTVMRLDNEFDDDLLLVAMSRHIDAQKAEELRLRDELYLRAEEIRVTAGQLKRLLCFYDVPTSTLTLPADYARRHGISTTVSNYPECMSSRPGQVHPDAPGQLLALYNAIRRGEPTGSQDVVFLQKDGAERWHHMEFATVFSQDGKPRRAVIFVDDVTETVTLSAEHERLKESERHLRMIAQHSDRVICWYDVATGRPRMWDPQICERCQLPRLCEVSLDDMLAAGQVLPDSAEPLRAMFADIHGGSPHGSLDLHAVAPDGASRWYDLQYSTLFGEDGAPVSALISHNGGTAGQ